MRGLTLAALALGLVLLLAAPAEARRRCGDGDRFAVVLYRNDHGDHRTALVVCRDGRRTVGRRSTFHFAPRLRGSLLTDADMTGGRVAWTRVRVSGGQATVTLFVAHLRRGMRVVEQVALLREPTRRYPPRAELVLSARGEVVWLAGERVGILRPGGTIDTLGQNAVDLVALEDERTVRWIDAGNGYAYADLRPWPADGCPRRERFETQLGTHDVLVTRAHYGDEDAGAVVLRACLRATGADPVVAQGAYSWGFSNVPRIAGTWGAWIVLVRDEVSRYHGCDWATVVVVRAGDPRARGREADARACNAAETPRSDEPVAVTDGGVPAWVVRDAEGSRLLVAGPDRSVVELDRGRPGSIRDLATEGMRVLWRHDGAPRSAEPP